MVYRSTDLFGTRDLLITRTDKEGTILACNDEFSQVSGYSKEELVNSPHSIVRHTDMPRGLFYHVWSCLKRNEPVGAFVHNAAKDGSGYWVFATMAILDDGFMSFRVLPTKAGIEFIEPIYAEMRAFEADQSHTPEQSAALMSSILAQKGYPDYPTFMAAMLAGELTARNTANSNKTDARIGRLLGMLKDWPMVGEECNKVFTAYEEFGAAPLNMRIQASQLNENGIALGVISSNFAELAGQINDGLTKFTESVGDVAETVNRCVFLTSTQSLLKEAETAIVRGNGATNESEILRQMQRGHATQSLDGLQTTLIKLSNFLSLAYSIKRSLSGLSVTRVMSAIENAQVIDSADNSISAIIEELRVFQEVTDSSLMRIQAQLSRFRSDLQRSMKTGDNLRKAA